MCDFSTFLRRHTLWICTPRNGLGQFDIASARNERRAYFYTGEWRESDQELLLFDKATKSGYIFKSLSSGNEDEKILSATELTNYRIRAEHFHVGNRISLNSDFDIIWDFYSLRSAREHFVNRLQQSLYNSRLKQRNDQIDVLAKSIDAFINCVKRNNKDTSPYNIGLSSEEIFAEIYGPRIIQHPAYFELLNEFEFSFKTLYQLNCFDYSPKSGGGKYRLTPTAVNILIEKTEDNRRHKALSTQNKTIAIFTVVTAVATLLNIEAIRKFFWSAAKTFFEMVLRMVIYILS